MEGSCGHPYFDENGPEAQRSPTTYDLYHSGGVWLSCSQPHVQIIVCRDQADSSAFVVEDANPVDTVNLDAGERGFIAFFRLGYRIVEWLVRNKPDLKTCSDRKTGQFGSNSDLMTAGTHQFSGHISNNSAAVAGTGA